MSNFKNISCQKFHETCRALGPIGKDNKSRVIWLVECLVNGPECDKEFEAVGVDIRSGRKKSCGCYRRLKTSKLNLVHGMSNSSEYHIYHCMLDRCDNPDHPAFKYYGGRGIKVCDRWSRNNPNGFQNFYADLGPRPSNNHTLERKENDDIYSPDNCDWLENQYQGQNRRSNIIQNRSEADFIRDLYKNKNVSVENIAEFFRCSKSSVWNILHYRAWN